MARNQGVFDFSANYEVKIVGPLDARMKVPSKTDLTSAQMTASYPYAGMIVSVTDDTVVNNGLYYLKQLPCVDANWIKVGSNDAYVNASYNTGIITLTRGDGTTTPLDIRTLITDNTISSMTVVGTSLVLTKSDSTTITTDLNNLQLAGSQLLKGVTTHDFVKLQPIDFGSNNFLTLFGGSAPDELIRYNKFVFSTLVAKETTILVDITGAEAKHYVLELPDLADANASTSVGKKVVIFVKKNGIPDATKRFLVSSKWENSGANNRILCVNSATQVAGTGYFLPLETMEMAELFWDGADWVSFVKNNQLYTVMDSQNFLTSVSDYVINR